MIVVEKVGAMTWITLDNDQYGSDIEMLPTHATTSWCSEDGGVGLRLAWEMVHTYGPMTAMALVLISVTT